MSVRVIVTGGRDYTRRSKVYDILNLLHPSDIYVGCCPTGVDAFVRDWASENWNTHLKVFKADWDQFRKAAGPLRNKAMLLAGDKNDFIVVAFPGGDGTADCVRQAKKLGYHVLQVEDEKES
jgi:hypothetical protein